MGQTLSVIFWFEFTSKNYLKNGHNLSCLTRFLKSDVYVNFQNFLNDVAEILNGCMPEGDSFTPVPSILSQLHQFWDSSNNAQHCKFLNTLNHIFLLSNKVKVRTMNLLKKIAKDSYKYKLESQLGNEIWHSFPTPKVDGARFICPPYLLTT